VGYRLPGGEEAVVQTETRLLQEAGHDVMSLVVPSEGFSELSVIEQATIALRLGDHRYGRRLMREAIHEFRPDVVHFHNLYPLLGPGAMRVARESGCATVQTFHNYRLSCIAGTHLLEGTVCERCSPGHHASGVVRGCYRGSRLQSLSMAKGVSAQWRLLAEQNLPNIGICLTGFMRDRLIHHGAPADTLVVKPNGVESGRFEDSPQVRHGVLFVGRLSSEKGILQLLDGWDESLPPLRIAGDGPLRNDITVGCEKKANVTYLGPLAPTRVREELSAARVAALPSRWYEGGLPLVVLESLAEGAPVVAFDLGAMTGLRQVDSALLCKPGDFEAFRARCSKIHAMKDGEWVPLSSSCRNAHADRYSHASSIAGLLEVYTRASRRSSKS